MKYLLKKLVFLIVCGVFASFSILYLSLWTTCEPPSLDPTQKQYAAEAGAGAAAELAPGTAVRYEDISCEINGEYTVPCRREGPEVFVPFYQLIHTYFEISGKLREGGRDGPVFEWQHAYSAVYPPKERYSPDGEFMSFRHYNVEVRERVKAINYEGVPISAQWNSEGYYYPIQIAQYGLSHYSKYLGESARTVTVLETGDVAPGERWQPATAADTMEAEYDDEVRSRVLTFESDDVSSAGLTLRLPVPTTKSEFTLSLDLLFTTNGSVSVVVEPKGKGATPFTLHYVQSHTLVVVDESAAWYGVGDRRTRWSRLTRDLAIDYQKALAHKNGGGGKKKAAKLTLARVVAVTVHGVGSLDNVTLASNAHLAQFYYAANWLVLHQDEQGGWPILVTRKIAAGLLEMPPGWYSAMAQGQAISLLVRAYLRSRNHKYLGAALRATHLYDVASADGGIQARFAGVYPWYEEYPTQPSIFVLNGFIYSLLGLYDLKQVGGGGQADDAARLYAAGLASLKQLLPLFDTGSGTIYDLRHFALGSAPNLARWDYHTTHINQLLLLATVEDDPVFRKTADRWVGYMKGKRAPHN